MTHQEKLIIDVLLLIIFIAWTIAARKAQAKEKSKFTTKLNTCMYCGSGMQDRKTLTGPRKGLKAKACVNYPKCKNIQWEVWKHNEVTPDNYTQN